ncbi:MAG: hypothetical protein VX806_05220 [Pseudomonadota bacterium]|nr:hypothetical protein [Pseudomonadota bacterium]
MRLRQVCFVAEDLESSLSELSRVFGTDVCFRDPGVSHFGLANGLLEVGGDFIEVVSPIKDNTTAGRFLNKMKGDSGYMLIFQCDNALAYREKAEKLNIRSIWKSDLDNGVSATHFHPKDINGVIMSIDSMNDENWKEKYSYWQWAGNNWLNEEKNNSFSIIGVTMKCNNSKSLSEKWSLFLDLPLIFEDNICKLKAKDFEINFIEDTNIEFNYMAELDVKVNDQDYKASMDIQEKEVSVCGVKINLT